MKTLKIYNTLQVTVMNDTTDWTESAESYIDEINEAIAHEDIDLAEYADEYHGATYYKKLHPIKMGTEFYGDKLYGLAICEVDDDWNDEDTEQLKEYLTGQYADGWGEGFEQREISEWTEEEECEEYDEEEDEYYTEYYDVRYYAYVNFWQCKTFRIMTEDELKS